MTVYAAAANGNLTAAATWGAIDATSYLNDESANTALTTSLVASAAFTPGAITIDGFAVKIASRTASPGSNTATFQLYDNTAASVAAAVTVNVSDIPTATATPGTTTLVSTSEGGWFFLKLASPITLTAGHTYSVRASTSASSQVNLYRNSTGGNWSRFLRTTTTGAPGAGDDMIITGEWTGAGAVTARSVTMDSTAATDYGNATTTQYTPALAIANNGTLSFANAASTNYILQLSGYLIVYNGGTLNIGISGSEIPRGSTATLQFDCGSTGDFGLVLRNGSTINSYGLSRTSGKNVTQCLLSADAAGGATSLTVDTDTGWLSGDVMVLAPTRQTASQYETASLNANAGASSLSLSAGTANAHDGTAPAQGEVGLLTRNVIITSVSSSLRTFIWLGNTATVELHWTEMSNLGAPIQNKYGLSINTTTGSANIQYCSVHDVANYGIRLLGSSLDNVTVGYTVVYKTTSSNLVYIDSATSGTWSFDHCMFCGTSSTSQFLFYSNDAGGNITNCSFSGGETTGGNVAVTIVENGAALGTFDGLSVHSCQGSGLSINSSAYGTISNSKFWRCQSLGATSTTGAPAGLSLAFTSCKFFGNGGVSATTGGFGFTGLGTLIFDGCSFNSDTTYTQIVGFYWSSGAAGMDVRMFSCLFSVASGILTANTNDLSPANASVAGSIIADNCIFSAATLFYQIPSVRGPALLRCQNFGQVANDNRSYIPNGTSSPSVIQTDTTTVYGSNPRSERMSPAAAGIKLESSSILVAVNSGQVAVPVIRVQKDGSYTGNAPRLILKRQDSMGVTADTVIDTLTAAAGSWQALTGSTPAAPQDGVFEFVIDCDGSAGSVYVGDTIASAA